MTVLSFMGGGGECYDLPGSVVSLVDAASVWYVVLTLLSGVD